MAIDLSDDELLNEIKRRKLPLTGDGTMVKLPMPTTENPTIWRKSDVGTALDRLAYDQRSSRARLVTDPNAATAAEVAVIRAARTRNPNTPGNFESMTDGARAEHWDRYFKGPPTPASNFPVASDFAGAQSPAQFWKNYTDVRLGRNLNPNLVSPEEASARMAGVATPSDLASASASAQANGGGFRAQTKYGPVSMGAPLTPEVKSGRFANGQKTWGAESLPDDSVSPIPPVRKSLADAVPDEYPNIDDSSTLLKTVAPTRKPYDFAGAMTTIANRDRANRIGSNQIDSSIAEGSRGPLDWMMDPFGSQLAERKAGRDQMGASSRRVNRILDDRWNRINSL